MKTLAWILMACFVLVFTINSFLATGDDFLVFWKAGRYFLEGQPLYDVLRDGPSCYKYPPWIAPLFIPISILPFRLANVVWRLLLLGSMLGACHWTLKGTLKGTLEGTVNGNRGPYLGLFIFISFWGVWMNNLISGQVTPLLLILALFGFSSNSAWRGLALFIALSAKIFNLISILGVSWRVWNKKTLGLVSMFVFLVILIALRGYQGSLPEMIKAFSKTAGDDSVLLGGANYGLPALWIHLFSIPLSTYGRVVAFCISLPLLIPLGWMVRSRQILEREAFALWLAIGAVLHPLQFSYGFVWVFPFTVFALERVFAQNRTKQFIWMRLAALIGLAGLTFLDRFVNHFGIRFLEGLPIRSLSLLVLVGLWLLSVEPYPRDAEDVSRAVF